MKLSDIKGERALDVLSEIIEPVAEIAGDAAIRGVISNPRKRLDAIKIALKKHKHSVIQIMAALDGETYEQYVQHLNVLSLPAKLVEIFNDPEMLSLFGISAQTEQTTSSTSASENTEA